MRIIYFFITLFFSTNLFAQEHISFMGVPLGIEPISFRTQIENKGMKPVSVDDNEFYKFYRYRGRFWKFDNCNLTIRSNKKKKGLITSVDIVKVDFIDRKVFLDLAASISEKYNKEPLTDKHDGSYITLIWKLKMGEIEINYFGSSITVEYTDILEKDYPENVSDDL